MTNEKETCLSTEDKETLAKIGEARKESSNILEIASLKNEVLDLKYKMFVSHIFKKYSLKDTDQILDDGSFRSGEEETPV